MDLYNLAYGSDFSVPSSPSSSTVTNNDETPTNSTNNNDTNNNGRITTVTNTAVYSPSNPSLDVDNYATNTINIAEYGNNNRSPLTNSHQSGLASSTPLSTVEGYGTSTTNMYYNPITNTIVTNTNQGILNDSLNQSSQQLPLPSDSSVIGVQQPSSLHRLSIQQLQRRNDIGMGFGGNLPSSVVGGSSSSYTTTTMMNNNLGISRSAGASPLNSPTRPVSSSPYLNMSMNSLTSTSTTNISPAVLASVMNNPSSATNIPPSAATFSNSSIVATTTNAHHIVVNSSPLGTPLPDSIPVTKVVEAAVRAERRRTGDQSTLIVREMAQLVTVYLKDLFTSALGDIHNSSSSLSVRSPSVPPTRPDVQVFALQLGLAEPCTKTLKKLILTLEATAAEVVQVHTRDLQQIKTQAEIQHQNQQTLMDKEIYSLQTQINQLTLSLNERNNMLNYQQSELQQAQQQCNHYTSHIQELNQELEITRNELQKVRDETATTVNSLRSQVDEMVQQLQFARQEATNASRRAEAAEERAQYEHNRAEAALADAHTSRTQMEASSKAAAAASVEIQRNLANVIAERNELRRLHTDTTMKINTQSVQLSAAQSAVGELLQQRDAANTALSESRIMDTKDNEELQDIIRNLREQNSQLENKLLATHNEITSLQSRLTVVSAAAVQGTLTDKKFQQSNTTNSGGTFSTNWEEKYEQLQYQLASVSAELTNQRAKNESLTRTLPEVRALEVRIATLERQLQNERTEADNRIQQTVQEYTHLLNLNSQPSEHEKLLVKKQNELETLRQQYLELSAENQNLREASTASSPPSVVPLPSTFVTAVSPLSSVTVPVSSVPDFTLPTGYVLITEDELITIRESQQQLLRFEERLQAELVSVRQECEITLRDQEAQLRTENDSQQRQLFLQLSDLQQQLSKCTHEKYKLDQKVHGLEQQLSLRGGGTSSNKSSTLANAPVPFDDTNKSISMADLTTNERKLGNSDYGAVSDGTQKYVQAVEQSWSTDVQSLGKALNEANKRIKDLENELKTVNNDLENSKRLVNLSSSLLHSSSTVTVSPEIQALHGGRVEQDYQRQLERERSANASKLTQVEKQYVIRENELTTVISNLKLENANEAERHVQALNHTRSTIERIRQESQTAMDRMDNEVRMLRNRVYELESQNNELRTDLTTVRNDTENNRTSGPGNETKPFVSSSSSFVNLGASVSEKTGSGPAFSRSSSVPISSTPETTALRTELDDTKKQMVLLQQELRSCQTEKARLSETLASKDITLRSKYEARITSLQEMLTKALETSEAVLDHEEIHLRNSTSNQFRTQMTSQELLATRSEAEHLREAVMRLQAELASKVASSAPDLAATLRQQITEADTKLNTERETHSVKIKALTNQHTTAMEALRAQHDRYIAALRAQYDATLTATKAEAETKLRETEADAERNSSNQANRISALENLVNELEQKCRAYDNLSYQIDQLQNEITILQEERNAADREYARVQTDMQTLVTSLKQRIRETESAIETARRNEAMARSDAASIAQKASVDRAALMAAHSTELESARTAAERTLAAARDDLNTLHDKAMKDVKEAAASELRLMKESSARKETELGIERDALVATVHQLKHTQESTTFQLTSQINSLKTELDTAKRQVDSTTAAVRDEASEEIHRIKIRYRDEQERIIAVYDEDQRKLRNEIQTKEHEWTKERKEFMDKLEHTMNDSLRLRNELDRTMMKATETETELRKKMDDLLPTITKLSRELTANQEQLRLSNEELDDARRASDKLKLDLTEVRSRLESVIRDAADVAIRMRDEANRATAAMKDMHDREVRARADALTAVHADLANERERHAAAVRAADTELVRVREESSRLRQQIERTESELATAIRQTTAVKEDYESVTRQLNASRDREKALTQRLSEESSAGDDARRRTLDLEGQLAGVRGELATTKQAGYMASKELDTLRAESVENARRVESLRAEVLGLTEVLARTRSDATEGRNSAERARTELNQARNDAEADIRRRTRENEQAMERMTREHAAEMDRLQRTHTAELAVLKASAERETEDVRAAANVAAEVTRSGRESILQARVTSLEGEIRRLETAANEAQTMHANALVTQRADMRSELESVKSFGEQWRRRCKELEDVIGREQTENQRLRDEAIVAANAATATIDKVRAETAATVAKTTAELEMARAGRDEQIQKLQGLYEEALADAAKASREATEAKEQLRVDIAIVKNELETVRLIENRLQNENRRLVTELTEAKELINGTQRTDNDTTERLRNEIQTLQNEHTRIRTEMLNVRSEMENAKLQEGKVTLENKRLLNELAELRKVTTLAQERIEQANEDASKAFTALQVSKIDTTTKLSQLRQESDVATQAIMEELNRVRMEYESYTISSSNTVRILQAEAEREARNHEDELARLRAAHEVAIAAVIESSNVAATAAASALSSSQSRGSRVNGSPKTDASAQTNLQIHEGPPVVTSTTTETIPSTRAPPVATVAATTTTTTSTVTNTNLASPLFSPRTASIFGSATRIFTGEEMAALRRREMIDINTLNTNPTTIDNDNQLFNLSTVTQEDKEITELDNLRRRTARILLQEAEEIVANTMRNRDTTSTFGTTMSRSTIGGVGGQPLLDSATMSRLTEQLNRASATESDVATQALSVILAARLVSAANDRTNENNTNNNQPVDQATNVAEDADNDKHHHKTKEQRDAEWFAAGLVDGQSVFDASTGSSYRNSFPSSNRVGISHSPVMGILSQTDGSRTSHLQQPFRGRSSPPVMRSAVGGTTNGLNEMGIDLSFVPTHADYLSSSSLAVPMVNHGMPYMSSKSRSPVPLTSTAVNVQRRTTSNRKSPHSSNNYVPKLSPPQTNSGNAVMRDPFVGSSSSVVSPKPMYSSSNNVGHTSNFSVSSSSSRISPQALSFSTASTNFRTPIAPSVPPPVVMINSRPAPHLSPPGKAVKGSESTARGRRNQTTVVNAPVMVMNNVTHGPGTYNVPPPELSPGRRRMSITDLSSTTTGVTKPVMLSPSQITEPHLAYRTRSDRTVPSITTTTTGYVVNASVIDNNRIIMNNNNNSSSNTTDRQWIGTHSNNNNNTITHNLTVQEVNAFQNTQKAVQSALEASSVAQAQVYRINDHYLHDGHM